MTTRTDGARQPGLSSRLRRAPGPRSSWVSPTGTELDLPVILDLVATGLDGAERWRVEATVDLRAGAPALTQLSVAAGAEDPFGLDVDVLQRDFRWATPVEAVARIVPRLLREGLDPFAVDFPYEGYPDITRTTPPGRLSDEFLEDVARAYLTTESGYAQALADHYGVSPRTVISWIEKARTRGILTRTGRGRKGGEIVPLGRRG